MSATDKYFQFQLCLLAMGDDETARLDKIISFAVVEAGRTLFQKVAPELRESLADELRTDKDTASDFKKNDSSHIAAALGARELNVTLGGIRGTVAVWERVCEFRDAFQLVHRRDTELRVPTILVFEVRDKRGMSYREFAIFCAMLSQIGDKNKPVRITRNQIQRRMLGYKSDKVMQIELSKRTDGATPLTVRQIGYTVDKLHERRFFARARANERQTFYSIRHTQDELEAALIQSKTYSQTFHTERRQHDMDFMARVKAAKGAIKVNAPIKVDNFPCSNDVHSAPAGVSASASGMVSALIETPLIETPLTKTFSIETLRNNAARDKGEKVFEEIIQPPKPELKPPTLAEVQSFATGLHKQCTPELAAQWFEKNGTDPKWTEHDWKKPSAKWMLNEICKASRKAKRVV